MEKDEAKNRIKKLKEVINRQRYLYHVLDKQEMSDSALDSLKKELVFSPSSLLLFSECRKKFEYRYIYNMPEEKPLNWEALKLGSFVHLVLEKGVKEQFSSVEEFTNCALELNLQEDWQDVEIEEALHLIKVFFERNKNKYNTNSKTEQYLTAEMGREPSVPAGCFGAAEFRRRFAAGDRRKGVGVKA